MPNYPVPYQNNWNYSGTVGQQMYPQYPAQSMAAQPMQQMSTGQSGHGLIWVDGEVGAKAYQMPAGWPSGQPIALWDTNDTVIYLKSTNPMGMPNPLQKAHYKLENYVSASPVKSGDAEPAEMPDLTQYVRKDDMERMKQELLETINGLSISGTAGKRTTTKGE